MLIHSRKSTHSLYIIEKWEVNNLRNYEGSDQEN